MSGDYTGATSPSTNPVAGPAEIWLDLEPVAAPPEITVIGRALSPAELHARESAPALLRACQSALPLLKHLNKFLHYQREGREFYPAREDGDAAIEELTTAIKQATQPLIRQHEIDSTVCDYCATIESHADDIRAHEAAGQGGGL